LEREELERIIEQVYGIHIPHNRIHKYLLEEGLAREEPKKKRRRKPYEVWKGTFDVSCSY